MATVRAQVESYIKHLNYGNVFSFDAVRRHTANAPRDTVHHALKKEVLNKRITHIRKGLYARPKMSRFGPVPVGTDAIIKALSKESGAEIYPSGAYALNALGLTTQIPMTLSYIATKRISSFHYGSIKVSIRYSQAFERACLCFNSIQKSERDRAVLFWIALEYLGKNGAAGVHDAVKKVFDSFSDETQNILLHSLGRKLAWFLSLL